MPLLQIAEPVQSAAPHEHRLAAGIDLGTTNSLVAVVRSGLAQTLPDAQGRHLLPSVVRFCATAPPLVGQAARDAAGDDPLNTIASAKRLIGRGIADVQRLGGRLPYRFIETDTALLCIHTAGGDLTPVEVSAEILKTLAQRAEDCLGGPLVGVVITVPAYFDDAQRQATKDAATLAGLPVLRLLSEPTAAALAYGLDQGAAGVHAVYDLGGGTFDISILRLTGGVFEVLATGGDSALGGDDLDRAVANWVLAQAGIGDDAVPGADPAPDSRLDTRLDQRTLRRLLQTAAAAKERLSTAPSADLRIELPDGRHWAGTLERATFEALVEPLIARSLAACRRALRDARVTAAQVDAVVLVGGSTRVPLVRARVAALFGREPLSDIDPDRVVALGAALQAEALVGNRTGDDLLLLDVIPLSLGIETMGGLVERLIPRNTTIPVARAQDFTTFKDGQTAMAIHVLQGERDLVADCRSLARFELRGIPPMVAGAARIRVTFAIDADGLLRVSADELTTGVAARVEVRPSYGLSDAQIESMLSDFRSHAQEDQMARRLREERVAGERVAESLRAALARDGDALLAADERARVDAALAHLQGTLGRPDAFVIRQAVRALERTCAGYVERRMNRSIQGAMAGCRLAEFDPDAKEI
ncbi:Fe-S protein assembly chaperone HscA [Candidatus Thiodictyon syntrophicum]|jgi:molecular chaperone HscA|uniref:Chaperone protein HscA homolog n=1 Tax=Candidatus Thiodictyon syntrophicum TaxID=1166950 RepID=A0A2K8UEW0_9GAMM|nr:Fe-S protein assembly chaperone HscA [Candidatus Thiodictyon syntrophicum]AUB84113.1 Fe-S protein assembly chaperone HscA [Candidatus Thiodictyon syntrophicum]